jgi:hypothetical protein
VRPGHERALDARRVLLEAVNVHFRAMSVSKCCSSVVVEAILLIEAV